VTVIDTSGVTVGVNSSVGVTLGPGVLVTRGGVSDGVTVGVATGGVEVLDGVTLGVTDGVGAGVKVFVGVLDGTTVGVGEGSGVTVGVFVGTGVSVKVGVGIGGVGVICARRAGWLKKTVQHHEKRSPVITNSVPKTGAQPGG
jgi:hypothetical protein